MRYLPADADGLWTADHLVREACNVYGNPAYHGGRQSTRAHGRTMVDDLRAIGGVEGLVVALGRLVKLPAGDLRAWVPPVERKTIRKSKAPTDADAGLDAIGPAVSVQGETRDIVVAGLVRRALSVHLARVLTLTGDALLPREAIAYRPHHRHVVKQAVLDVARSVRQGHIYWAKLDVRAFFPSVPWRGIEQALLALGYSEAFVAIVMALVTSPIEARGTWGRWLPVENDSGAQAGLQESSILANVFLADLDRALLKRFGGVLFYRRYSDDLIMMAKTKEVCRRAVVMIREWVTAQGLQLKGPRKPVDARSLVHDIRKLRVEFLGAEINAQGSVAIPAAKVALFETRLRHRAKYEMTEGGPYVGVSKLAVHVGGNDRRGLYRFEPLDLWATVESFVTYWRGLGAVNLDRCIDNLLFAQQIREAGRPAPHPWVAYLGLPTEREEARSGDPPGRFRTHLGPGRVATPLTTEQIRTAWEAVPIEHHDDQEDGSTRDEEACEGAEGLHVGHSLAWRRGRPNVAEGGEGAPDHGTASTAVWGNTDRDPEDVHADEGARSLPGDRPEGAGPPHEIEGSSDERHIQDGDEDPWVWTGRSEGLSGGLADGSEDDHQEVESYDPSPGEASFRFLPSAPHLRLAEVHLSPPSKAGEGGLENTRYLFLDHVSRAGRIRFASLTLDGPIRRLESRVVWARRWESALVRQLARHVLRAAHDGAGVLVVRLGTSWLPRLLLTGAVRSPSLQEALLDLHALAARVAVHVVVGGPTRVPQAVQALLRV